jgi:hypothetical protein
MKDLYSIKTASQMKSRTEMQTILEAKCHSRMRDRAEVASEEVASELTGRRPLDILPGKTSP